MPQNTDPNDGFDVAFLGRANIDLTVRVPYRASPGRTAIGSSLIATPGGKSLNQAVAAARLGARCCLIANTGADAWGQQLTTALTEAGVETRYFKQVEGAHTGAAIIEVTPDGESYVTLALSPATELTIDDVRDAVDAITTTTLVVQLDLPPEPVTALLTQRRFPLIVGNLIPHAGLDRAMLQQLDILVVNQHEAAAILHTPVTDPLDAVTRLRRLGPDTVVVTAGAQGAAYDHPDGSGTIPAPTVPVIDTTGAGDAFLGALTLALTRRTPLPEAVATAVHTGSLAVQHASAQPPVTNDTTKPGRGNQPA